MRNTIIAVVLFLISSSHGFADQPKSKAQTTRTETLAAVQTETPWTKFSSSAGRFSVLLPKEPTFETVAATDSGGITNYRYSDIENGYGFICEYFDVDSTGDDVQSFLDVTRDGIVRGADATLAGEQKISLNTYPGRELQLVLKLKEGTEITGLTRIYLVDKRLYSLTFLRLRTMEAAVAADLGKKFFSSFELKK